MDVLVALPLGLGDEIQERGHMVQAKHFAANNLKTLEVRHQAHHSGGNPVIDKFGLVQCEKRDARAMEFKGSEQAADAHSEARVVREWTALGAMTAGVPFVVGSRDGKELI